jgi:hypothetical protein
MLYPNWNSWSGRSVPTVLVGSPYPSGFSPPFETRRPLHQFYYSVVPEDLTSLAQVTSRLSGSPELGCSKEKGRLSCVSKYVSQIHSGVDVSRSDVSTPCMSSVGTYHRSGKTRLFTLLMHLLRGLSPNQTYCIHQTSPRQRSSTTSLATRTMYLLCSKCAHSSPNHGSGGLEDTSSLMSSPAPSDHVLSRHG